MGETKIKGLKVYLEYHLKPFTAKTYKGYSGFYTPKGLRNQRAKIEINSNDSMLAKIDTDAHEHGHFMFDLHLGDAHNKSPHAGEREDEFCYLYGKITREMFRRFLDGKSLDDFEELLPEEESDD